MKKVDENRYRKNVRLAFQSIEKGIAAIKAGNTYEDWKPYLQGLYHFSVSSSLLTDTYQKIQVVRARIIDLLETNPKFNENVSFRYLAFQLQKISRRIADHLICFDDSPFAIDSFLSETKDLDLFEEYLKRYPYRINCIESKGKKFLSQVMNQFFLSLKKHILKENYDYLDDVLYFNHLLQTYLQKNYTLFSFSQKRELFEAFKKAKMELPDVSIERKERYYYFLNPYLIAFSKELDSSLKKKKNQFSFSRNSDDILYECMIERSFSRPILNEVQFVLLNSSLKKGKKRTQPTFYTVDSMGSRILDDGFSITKNKDLYHLKICVTNPFAFFSVDSILFDEAMKRTASLHVEPEHIFMFPYEISHNLGSLTEGRMHPCVTLSFDIDPVYKEIISFHIKRESVYIKKNFEYSEFRLESFEQQEDLDGILCYTLLQEILPTLRNFYTMSDAYKMLFRKEKNPTSTNITESFSSALAVETLMVFANTQLAQFCFEHHYPILYRNHFLSKEQKILIDSLMRSLEGETSRDLAAYKLKQLRSIYPKSNYGDINFGHLGLGVSHYMHFTSPFQRASDLLNMNVLLECHFQNVDELRQEYLKERTIAMASYINNKSVTFDLFSKEYRRALEKK